MNTKEQLAGKMVEYIYSIEQVGEGYYWFSVDKDTKEIVHKGISLDTSIGADEYNGQTTYETIHIDARDINEDEEEAEQYIATIMSM